MYTTPKVHMMTNITIFVALYCPTGHPFKINHHSHCACPLNFNVFLTFITATNFHQLYVIRAERTCHF